MDSQRQQFEEQQQQHYDDDPPSYYQSYYLNSAYQQQQQRNDGSGSLGQEPSNQLLCLPSFGYPWLNPSMVNAEVHYLPVVGILPFVCVILFLLGT